MTINKLTQKLLAEGYTKENHPDYVSDWNDFYVCKKLRLNTKSRR